MTILIQLNLFLITTCTSWATVEHFWFKELDQNFTGIIAKEHVARTQVHCSIMCSMDEKCYTYQYKRTGTRNCILIQRVCVSTGGQVFQWDNNNVMYSKGRRGPQAVFYQSFDSSDGLVLWEGTQQVSSVKLVAGQVNCALTLDGTMNQWIDLGVHTEACMTLPETCGAAGGAISLWFRVYDCTGLCGFVSSQGDGTSGSRLYGKDEDFEQTGWFHFVVNYIGPNDGDGIRIFYDGVEVASDSTRHPYSLPAGDGRIVVGRFHTGVNDNYGNGQIDELLFFNQALSVKDIKELYNKI